MYKMIPDAHFQTVLDIWNERQEKSSCTITGNCMSPMIREGDRLVIEHGSQNVRSGDVVVFGSPGKFLVHRVIRVSKSNGTKTFLLKADRNTSFHPPVNDDEILGRVIEVHGSNGRIDLNSAFWRSIDYVLMVRSYIGAKRRSNDSAFWKALNPVLDLRPRIKSGRFGVGNIFWQWVYWIHRRRRGRETQPLNRKPTE